MFENFRCDDLFQEYYDEVIEATKCTGVRVSCSSKHGKGTPFLF